MAVDFKQGFLSWDMESCHVALDKELQAIISQAPEGEEAKNGERLIQFASENLVTEVLINPQLNTLIQCVRNLLSSFTKHRHIIHAGYTFAGNGSWIVQDGTFSLADLIDAFQETEVQRVLRAYELSVTVDIHCAPEGEWSTARLRRESFGKLCRVRVNPDDSPSPAENISQFVDYLAPFISPASVDQLLEPSDVVGNIRFSHPTLYVFPGGQGDAALFGINGFNMLVDGGFSRKACFWDFARHLDRLDAVLMTRINNSNINGIASVLRRKTTSQVYPQIGHFFCNLQDRKQPCTPEEEKVRDSLLVNLLDEGQEIVQNLRHLQMKPHVCVRDSVLDPINLYHKVGHGKLDMYVISPAKDSKELKEFLSKWHSHDISLFSSSSKKPGDKDITFPLPNLVSICALLVWQPANPEDTITRILFPGSTPQQKIFEGLEKLRCLEFMKQPVCTAKTLSPSSSTIGISSKVSKVKSSPAVIDKLLPGEGLNKPVSKITQQPEPIAKQNVAKVATIPVSGAGEYKPKPPAASKPVKPKIERSKPDNKTDTDKNIEIESELISKQDKPAIISDQSKDNESSKPKTEKPKLESKPKKVDAKVTSKLSEKKTKSSSIEKKDSVKSSPTTPKKSVDSKVNGVAAKSEIIKSSSKVSNRTKTSPSATPAKSTKEENNRKVAESKVRATALSKTTSGKLPKREESLSRQKAEKKVPRKTSSPVRATTKPVSPVKATTKTAAKQKKEQKKFKLENEKGIITDSSTVSTPSTVDAEMGITKDINASKEESIPVNVQQNIEDKLKDMENGDSVPLVNGGKIHQPATISKHETSQLDSGEKDFSEKEEEDEILIIEKVELEPYGDDSTHDQESLESHIPDETEDEIQKHLRDEAESEKKKEDEHHVDNSDIEKIENAVLEVEDKVENNELLTAESSFKSVPVNLAIDTDQNTLAEKILSPENRDQIEEEVQEIITSATDFVSKTKLEQSKESSELSAEGFGSDEQKTSAETKDLSSADKVNIMSDKNLTDNDNKHDDTKDKSRELGDTRFGAEESQPDEKFSTTVESGATTAPTLPEDERIPLDEIKEGIEEKYDKEDTKEKEVGAVQGRLEQPTSLPQVSVVSGGKFETQVSHVIVRDIVKTPDEVADLPVHEEVDGLYEDENFIREGQKGKEDLLNIGAIKKDSDVSLKHSVKADSSSPAFSDKLSDGVQDTEKQAMAVDARDLKIISRDDQGEVKLPMEKVLHEDDLIHSTLKAPEIAELVLVTPDSAPDSPMHRLEVDTDGIGKSTDIAKREFEETPQETQLDVEESVLKPEDNLKLNDEIIEKGNLCSDVTGDIINGSNDTTSLNFDINKTKVSTLGDPSDEIDKQHINKLPKTPPASPVLFGVEKDHIHCKTDEIEEMENDSHLKQVDVATVLDNKDADQVLDQLGLKQESTISNDQDANQSYKVTNVGNNEPVITENGYGPDKEQFDAIESTAVGENAQTFKTLESLNDGCEEKVELKDESTIQDVSLAQEILPSEDNKANEQISEKSKKELSETKTMADEPALLDSINVPSEITEDSKLSIEKSEIVDPKTNLYTDNSKVPEDTKLATEKQDIPKSMSPTGSEQNEESTPVEDTTLKTQKLDFPEIISPVLNKDIDQSKESKDTPKSISPVPCDMKDESQVLEDSKTFEEKRDTPQSISTVLNENIAEIQGGKDAKEIKDKQDTPKSLSPVPSEEKEENKTTKETELFVDKNQTPKSISPVPSEKIDESPALEDNKQYTPKSVSPVQNIIEHEIIKDTKEITENQKHDTPKSISPAPSEEKEESQIIKESKLLEDKHHTPKSISPVQSEVDSLALADNKKDTLKTVRPEQNIENIIKSKTLKDSEELAEKQDTPKSISPVPSKEKDDIQTIKEITLLEDQHHTPKSISPVPSENLDGSQMLTDNNKVSPKSVSPVQHILNVIESEIPKDTKEITEKHDSPKSISPVPSKEKDDMHTIKEVTLLEDQHHTPKSISPVPSENLNESQILTDNDKVSPKSVSPVQNIESEIVIDTKEITDKDTPKSISPVASKEKDDDKTTTQLEDKHCSPKSISPVLRENIDDSQALTDEKQDSPKALTPTPNGNIIESQIIEEAILIKEKQDTTKSISPVLSEKKDKTEITTETVMEDKHTPKSVSPEPSENIYDSQAGTDKKSDTPKTQSPIPSEHIEGQINQAAHELAEKHDIPNNINTQPSVEKDKNQTPKETKSIEAKEEPKNTSPLPSEKLDDSQDLIGNQKDIPKSISPVQTENINEIQTIGDAKAITDQQGYKSISPLASTGKGESQTEESNLLEDKQHSPKSTSPVPNKNIDENQDVIVNKQISPKSISPVPSEKLNGVKSIENAEDITEKQDISKGVSSLPSENIDDSQDVIHFKQSTPAPKEMEIIEEKQDTLKDISAEPGIKQSENLTLKEIKPFNDTNDTEIKISSVSGEKSINQATEDAKTSAEIEEANETKTAKERSIREDKPDSPKSISPILSENSQVIEGTKEIIKSSLLLTETLKETMDEKYTEVISDKTLETISLQQSKIETSNETKSLGEKEVSSKSNIPDQVENFDDVLAPKDITATTEKQDKTESISSFLNEKKDESHASRETLLEEQQDNTNIVNFVTSENDKDSSDQKDNNLETEKKDSSKSVSPASSETGGDRKGAKEHSILEEHDTINSVNPVNSLEEKYEPTIDVVINEKGDDSPTHKGTDQISTKQDMTKNISPLPSDNEDQKETKTLEEKQDTPKSISPVPSENGSSLKSIITIKDTHDTPQSSSLVPSSTCDEIDDAKEAKSIEVELEQEDENKVKGKHGTPQTFSSSCSGNIVTPEENILLEETKTQPKSIEISLDATESVIPVESEKGNEYCIKSSVEKEDIEKISPLITSKKSDVSTLSKEIITSEDKHDTPQCLSPVLKESTENKHVAHDTLLNEDDTHKSTGLLQDGASNIKEVPKQTKSLEEEKHEVSKSLDGDVALERESTVFNGKRSECSLEKRQDQDDLEETKALDKSHDSPSRFSPVADVVDDASKNTLTETMSSKATQNLLQNSSKPPSDAKSEDNCEKVQSTNTAATREEDYDQTEGTTTEKSETELPEKCKFEPSEDLANTSKQEEKEIGESTYKLDRSIDKLQECGINETFNKPIEVSDAPTPQKVPVLTSSMMESNGKLENKYFSKEDSGSEPNDLTNSFHPKTESSNVSQETPLPAKQLVMTSEVSDKELVTNAVIENTLESKDIKTVESINTESSSIVPSSTLVINSKDSELATATSQISYDDRSSSVHRMLVTGSSEDGGTETELCSSSVTQIVGSSYDKQLGNVSHETEEDLAKTECIDKLSKTILVSSHGDLSSTDALKTDRNTEIDSSKTIHQDCEKPTTQPSPIVICNTDPKQSEESIAKLQQESSGSFKPADTLSSGQHSSQLKKDITDSARSGTPASDLMSDREMETGGPSTPHSDISSGQVSRVATHTWESEGRQVDSDDDLPCSPMSAASHAAQSPPQFDFDVHQHSKEGFYQEALKPKELPSAMTSSLYGSLPEEDPLDEFSKHLPVAGDNQMYSSMYVSKYGDDDHEETSKPYSADSKGQFEPLFGCKKDDIDFETAVKEHISTRGEDLTTQFTNGSKDIAVNGKSNGLGKQPYVNGKGSQPESLEYQDTTQSVVATTSGAAQTCVASKPVPTESSSSAKPSADDNKDPIEGWGKPLGLPPPPKSLIESPLSRSTLTLVWNPADEWGIPLGLPSPAPPTVKKDSMNGDIDSEITPTSNKTTPKKVARRNAENKSASNTQIGKEASNKTKHPESPVKRGSNKDSRAKLVSPVYMDLTYVPHHGNSHYTNVEFFKRVRARYYVFSGTEPSREVFNALLEAKQTWEDKELEVTIIPTYDTDTLGYWVAENEDVLAKHKIDLSPSASRCTINLQDHETSCSAYRLEF